MTGSVASINRGSLAGLLRRARNDSDLSMRELARRSGLSAAQISRIESGDVDKPSVETLAKLAQALDRPAETLFVAAGHLDVAESLSVVRRHLESLPPGASGGDLSGALHELNAQDETINELRKQAALIDAQAKAKVEHLEHSRAELSFASREAERLAASLTLDEAEGEHAVRLQEARDRARSAYNAMTRNEAKLDQRRADVENTRAHLEAEQRRLEEMVRHYAGRLFVRRGANAVYSSWPVSITSPDVSRLYTQAAHWWSRGIRDPDEVLIQKLDELRGRLSHGPDDRQFRELAQAWESLTTERREKVLDFVDDQRRLSLQEQQEAWLEEVREAGQASPGESEGT